MNQVSFVGKVWRRLRREKMFAPCITRIEDVFRAQRFLHTRNQALDQYRNCATPADYLALSNSVLGSHQSKAEILAFLDFARSRHPRRVAEIGTAMGGTNFLLSQALPDVTMMVGVDLFVANQTILRTLSRPGQDLHFFNGSSYGAEMVTRVGRLLAGEPLDLLFIDGDHTYEGARKDFARYRQFVRPGGLIAFHDIVPDYQTRFGRQTGRWAGDVPILWRDLKGYYAVHEFIENPEQDGLGIGVIEYDPAVSLPAELAN